MIVDPTIGLAVESRAEHQEVDLELTLAAPLSAVSAEFWKDWLDYLCTAVTCGAVADPAVPVGTARMQPLAPYEIHDTTVRSALDVDGIGPSAWKVILNMLLAASACTTTIDTLRIAARKIGSALLTAKTAFAQPFPPTLVPLPYILVREEPADPTRQRLIRLEFARALSQAEFDHVATALLAWTELVNGGYPGVDLHPMENACDALDPAWVLPNAVQCEIPNYLGAEEGFDALVNIAVTLHHALCPLRVLSID